MSECKPLPVEALSRRCAEEDLPFATTAELADLADAMGQPRAAEALEIGIGIRRPGFNLFAFGPIAAATHEIVRRSIERRAAGEEVPSDWVYVHDFDRPQGPRAIALPAGVGCALREDIDRLIDDLRAAIPAAFETEEYRARAHVIEEELKERQQKAFEELEQRARATGLALIRTPLGMGLAPLAGDEVMDPGDFAKLPAEEREAITARISAMQEELQHAIALFPQWQREAKARMRELNRELAEHAVHHLLEELREKYAPIARIVEHLGRLQEDVVAHVDLFRPREAGPPSMPGEQPLDGDHAALRRYQVNVLVDHRSSRGAPVVYEPHPTYQNLVGRIEHRQWMGTLTTDFLLVKPGALHHANGGYLLLDARKVLGQPFAWEGLKQALRAREIRIESLGEAIGVVSTVSLEPEHIPLDVKVVLVDEPRVYYLLHLLDPDFRELFKVAADFDDRMPRTPQTTLELARAVATEARGAGLRALERAAVARVVEHGSRCAGDGDHLSLLLHDLADLLAEADFRAAQRGAALIGAADVQAAIDGAIRRSDRLRERLLEETVRGTISVETEGSRIGQVNGLSVLALGDFSFGRPSRITARVRVGNGEVVDIEWEVDLGGPIHSKGVLILSSFLATRYAADEPLSLAASLVFEQSYGGVEGDSASCAELYALLSALAELPIRQDLAVTGSVDQHGEVQAIGGVNEKIEGFFQLCQRRGLTGCQGVLVPRTNRPHLMLRDEVIAAAAGGQFAVYSVGTIDEGIELLTGVPAGVLGADGLYPEATVNRRVADRLKRFAERRRSFARPPAQEAQ